MTRLRKGVAVEITIRREPSLVDIEVADNGPGIPADVLPHIFDPFFSIKGNVGGVGLGLFVAEGSRVRAAELLGMGRTTLWRKMRSYGIESDESL